MIAALRHRRNAATMRLRHDRQHERRVLERLAHPTTRQRRRIERLNAILGRG